jgi:hypothetical protein
VTSLQTDGQTPFRDAHLVVHTVRGTEASSYAGGRYGCQATVTAVTAGRYGRYDGRYGRRAAVTAGRYDGRYDRRAAGRTDRQTDRPGVLGVTEPAVDHPQVRQQRGRVLGRLCRGLRRARRAPDGGAAPALHCGCLPAGGAAGRARGGRVRTDRRTDGWTEGRTRWLTGILGAHAPAGCRPRLL